MLGETGRIYLASFTRPPTPQTPFHYPYKQEKAQTPSKRSGRARLAAAEAVEASIPPVYFSVDELLLYNAFYADFGPLHIGHLYRFAVYLHNILGDPAHEKRRIVLWSRPDARSMWSRFGEVSAVMFAR
jgi:cell division cycle 14